MATGTVALEQLRGAIETSEGNADTPTRILYVGPAGNIDASGVQKRETLEDRRAWGKRTSLYATYSGVESTNLTISNIPMAYESLGWWLSAVAPTGGGIPGTVDTSAYERTFTPVEGTTLNTFGTGFYTLNLEYAPSDLASTIVRQMPAMRVTSLAFNFSKRSSGTDTGATMDIGLEMTTGTATNGTSFNGSLSDYDQALILGNQLTSYIDTTTIGTTGDTDVATLTFNLDNPVSYHDGMDGQNGHTSAHHAQQWTPTVTLSRKFSNTTELDTYLAKTARKIRIEAEGDVVGSSTATNKFQFDFYGSPTDHRQTEVDGIVYAEIDLEGIYDSTATTSWTAWLRNNVAAAYTAT